jgi:hypothetical protein
VTDFVAIIENDPVATAPGSDFVFSFTIRNVLDQRKVKVLRDCISARTLLFKDLLVGLSRQLLF